MARLFSLLLVLLVQPTEASNECQGNECAVSVDSLLQLEKKQLGLEEDYQSSHFFYDGDILKETYLGLLVRALTGGLVTPGLPEPFQDKLGHRANGGCDTDGYRGECLLTWDGYQRAVQTGKVLVDVLRRGVPGAVAEVGVYMGGMCAYFQGILIASGEAQKGRELWLIDSFEGLPDKDGMVSKAAGDSSKYNSDLQQGGWAGLMNISLKSVRGNLARHRLLEPGNVNFLEGWVQDTLPGWPVNELALIRIDVDVYAATYDALHYLYPRLSQGGAVLFDDWKLEFSKQAILDYRKKHGIQERIMFLKGTVDPMAYWIKKADKQ